ncbi:hypothetical protein SynWH8101_0051 [Synechococcus sp. WH 8101]|nr:hypothetical protein SynWH8101_0051 [Synechococcus sp. WH 8101]QNI43863.1 hypothetical protein SynRCC2555_00053 [Synechococcus sp. WH 8101]
MNYTPEQLDAMKAKTQCLHNARNALKKALRQVLNSPEHERLSNYCKADILLDLENNGEYNPLG